MTSPRPPREDRRRGRNDLVAGLGLAALSALLLAYTVTFPGAPGSADPGAAFLPRLLLSATLILSLALAVQSRRPRRQRRPPPDAEAGPREARSHTVAVAVAICVLYLVAIRFDLYFAATPIFLAALLWLAGIRSAVLIAFVSLGFVLFAYAMFFRVLDVPLAGGP